MAKLQRKSAKVFAEQAQAAVGGIAQFGSLAAGDIQYSKDVDVIQALDAYKEGWQSAVVGNKSPAMEDRNALDYLLSYQQAYIMQHGVPEWLSTETYYKNSYVVDSNGELRVSIGDNNTGHDPILDEGGQYWGYAGARGSGKRVGEVYFSQSKNATDNPGALPLFTGEVVSNANNIYPEFYTWVSNHPELCVTQAQYESKTTQYGECPYYVLDTVNHTIRLPKLVNYIKMANTTNGITQSAAGLPQHTHSYDHAKIPDNGEYQGVKSDDGPRRYVTLQTGNATDTNGIYGASNTVTPAHTTVFPWVCAYQSAIPASTAQAAQFLQTMSSKVDVNDLDEVYCVVQTGNNGVTGNGSKWYRIYSDGWCEQGGILEVPMVQNSERSTTITLLKEFTNAYYSVSAFSEDRSGIHLSNIAFKERTTTDFKLVTYTTGSTDNYVITCWEAKGYVNIQ